MNLMDTLRAGFERAYASAAFREDRHARRIAAAMALRTTRRKHGGDLPALDNEACKRLGLPHQGSREMARRAKRMEKQP